MDHDVQLFYRIRGVNGSSDIRRTCLGFPCGFASFCLFVDTRCSTHPPKYPILSARRFRSVNSLKHSGACLAVPTRHIPHAVTHHRINAYLDMCLQIGAVYHVRGSLHTIHTGNQNVFINSGFLPNRLIQTAKSSHLHIVSDTIQVRNFFAIKIQHWCSMN